MEDPNRNLEEQIKRLCDRTSDTLDRRILHDLAGKLKECQPSQPASKPAGILGRMTMTSKRIKIATAAVVVLAILLPAGYAALEAVVRHFTISQDQVSFDIQESDGRGLHAVATRRISVSGTNIATEEEAQAGLVEFRRLYQEGKAKEIEPGVWQVTLANGGLFYYRGDPRWTTAEFTPEEKEQMKQEFEEIAALQKAGKCEKKLLEESEQNGVKSRVYEVRYTLANGKVVTRIEGECVGTPGSAGGGPVTYSYREPGQPAGEAASKERGFHEGP
jgi:hypothetical protein